MFVVERIRLNDLLTGLLLSHKMFDLQTTLVALGFIFNDLSDLDERYRSLKTW